MTEVSEMAETQSLVEALARSPLPDAEYAQAALHVRNLEAVRSSAALLLQELFAVEHYLPGPVLVKAGDLWSALAGTGTEEESDERCGRPRAA